jgi:dTDP-4-dehydrorhamnose 3,5-epimerase-like enzyme
MTIVSDRLERQTVRGDARGNLVAIEAGRDVPFEIARVYYLYGTDTDVARGFHAHRTLRQWAVCVAGSCTMLLDDGAAKETLTLDDPAAGVAIPPMVWHEMRDFVPGTVLLVLANQHYDESDYIRNYDDFCAALGTAGA